jgi:tRNA(Ile2) C34 agmatinyltransferase TiaS
MLYTKACPRCQGDMSRVEDIGDTYFSCVQCGHTSYTAPGPMAVPTADGQRTWLSAVDRSVARKRRINRTPARPARAA